MKKAQIRKAGSPEKPNACNLSALLKKNAPGLSVTNGYNRIANRKYWECYAAIQNLSYMDSKRTGSNAEISQKRGIN